MAVREVLFDTMKYGIVGSGGKLHKENSGQRHKIIIRIMEIFLF